MPRKKKAVEEPPSLLDITAKLRSGPYVPALREALKAWKAADCKGITDTTRTLLNFWFRTDHKLKTGRPFKYHASQQEAIETLIYVWEVERICSRKDLLESMRRMCPICGCRWTTALRVIARRWRPAAARPRSWRWRLPGSISTHGANKTRSRRIMPKHFYLSRPT